MAYQLIGHRPSALPIAQYCGQAPLLDRGSTRTAFLSQVFHAKSAKAQSYPELYARLTPEEQDDVDQWKEPEAIRVEGHVLEYADAEKEQAIGLTMEGSYAVDGPVLTAGTLDLAWNYNDIAYVQDIKKNARFVWDGPNSLQLIAYGLAYADKMGARYMCTGLWDAIAGYAEWSPLVEVNGLDGLMLFERVKAAALNTGEFTTGAHCRGCFARLKCPEHVLPPIVQSTSLAALSTATITPDNAPELLRTIQAGRDVFEAALETMKAYVAAGGVIRDGDRVWREQIRKGRRSASVKKLEDILGPKEAARYCTEGKPYQVYDWVKA